MNDVDPYTTLVCSGGGINGISIIGVLYNLEEKKLLDNISNYAGTSIGGMICLLLSIGYDVYHIYNYIEKSSMITDIQESITSIFSTNGVVDYPLLIDSHLRFLVFDKLKKIPTMSELFKTTNKWLTLVTFEPATSEKIYIDHENFPDLLCTDAVRMTCNIPFIFSKFTYNNKEYIDGGIVDNFPIELYPNTRKIGININFCQSEGMTGVYYLVYCIKSAYTFFQKEKTRYTTQCIKDGKLLLFNVIPKNHSLHFNVNIKDIFDLFLLGYKSEQEAITYKEILDEMK